MLGFVAVGDPNLDSALLVPWRDMHSLGSSGLDYNLVLAALLVADGLLNGGNLAKFIPLGFDLDLMGLPLVMAGLNQDLLGASLVITGNPAAVTSGLDAVTVSDADPQT